MQHGRSGIAPPCSWQMALNMGAMPTSLGSGTAGAASAWPPSPVAKEWCVGQQANAWRQLHHLLWCIGPIITLGHLCVLADMRGRTILWVLLRLGGLLDEQVHSCSARIQQPAHVA